MQCEKDWPSLALKVEGPQAPECGQPLEARKDKKQILA